MHFISHPCLIRIRSITACFPTRLWWRDSCASSFRRRSRPASISPDCGASIPSFTSADGDAPTETDKLIALSPDSALWPWQSRTRYYLLDMGAFPKDALARRSGLAALLFRLEQRHSPEELKDLLAEVIGWFRQHEDFEQLRGLFAELVREALAGLGVTVTVPVSEDLLEMKTNLSTLGESWKQQWLAEGRVEGLARGKAEGKAEVKAEALLCLLVERFGAVAPSWHKRIRGAKLATLDRWFKRAIVARDVSSVFELPH